MNALELAQVTADPIQTLGLSFYFDPVTAAHGRELGLNPYEFYGLGRAGVLGDASLDEVEAAFTFFHRRTLERMYENARAKAEPVATSRRYIQEAYGFADRTFGAVPVGVLVDVADATRATARAVPPGRHHLFDGYRAADWPTDPVHAAYLSTIWLRELRGGVHMDAVAAVGLSPLEACYLQDVGLFKLHGYVDDEAPVVTAEHEAMKVRAEQLTSESMAEFFATLTDAQRESLADGTAQMYAALATPVAVTN